MNDNGMIELTQELLNKIDEIVRPFILYLNPEDAELIKESLPNAAKMFVIKETTAMEHGKCIVIERHEFDYLRLSEMIG